MLTEEKIELIKRRIYRSDIHKEWMQDVLKLADECLFAEPLEHKLEDGGIRLLYTSRKALLAIENMAFVYKITGDKKYGKGAVNVLMRICDDNIFPDWNPYHFIDVAEMAAAAALGYDWCYELLTNEQRQTIKNAIVEKALIPVMEDYNEVEDRVRTWYWSSKVEKAYPQNWVAVCFGGTAMAALAIGDEDLGEFKDAGNVITEGMMRVRDWLDTYMPDGACSDGTGYWEFAMEYMVFGFDSMQTSLKTDYSMSKNPGFVNTYSWLSQMMGNAGAFNFGSNNTIYTNSPEYFWQSARVGDMANANFRINKHLVEWGLKATYKDILWYEPEKEDKNIKLTEEFSSKGGVNTTVLRNGYKKEDTWLAFYGGTMAKSPETAQNDKGTFVLDMLGERWALDLGAEWQTYVALEVPRYEYYRFRAEGHNTVIIQPDSGFDQDPSERGIQEVIKADDKKSFAIYDLTTLLAYKGAKSHKRGISVLKESGNAIVQDELKCEKEVEFYWFMHTDAEIIVVENGKKAVLKKNGKEIEAILHCDNEGISFSVMDAVPLETSPHPKVQTENKGVRKLTIHKKNIKNLNMAVEFKSVEKSTEYNFLNLSEWKLL